MPRTSIVPQVTPDAKIRITVKHCASIQSAPVFPVSLALDVNEVLNICQEKASCFYYVATKSYIIAPNGDASQRYRAEYTTLVPYRNDAPRFVLERNMYGFYFVDLATGLIDSQKHTAFMRLIESRNAPVVTVSSTIIESQIVHPAADLDTQALVLKPATLLESDQLDFLDFSVEGMKIEKEEITPATSCIVDEKGRALTASTTGWQAESKSQPGTFHDVSLDGSACSCKGFNGHYHKCWHTALLHTLC